MFVAAPSERYVLQWQDHKNHANEDKRQTKTNRRVGSVASRSRAFMQNFQGKDLKTIRTDCVVFVVAFFFFMFCSGVPNRFVVCERAAHSSDVSQASVIVCQRIRKRAAHSSIL